eukprot:02997.XXX_54939_54534_1 [CDS] Oithona nana genome sequencing.
MKNYFHLLLVIGVLSVFCKTLLGEPVAMPSEEESEEFDYEGGEGGDFHASIKPIDEESEEDRFFFGGLKCAKYAGVCNALCASVNFNATQACEIRWWFWTVRCVCSIYG